MKKNYKEIENTSINQKREEEQGSTQVKKYSIFG